MKLIIFGAGYPTIVSLIMDINAGGANYEILGFSIDDESKIGDNYMGYPILGSLENLKISDDTFIINNIGSSTFARNMINDRIYKIKSHIPSLIHPRVEKRFSKISDEGCIVMQDVFVGPGSTVGQSTVLRNQVLLGHDNHVGDCVFISVHSVIMGYTSIESYSFIGGNSTILPKLNIGNNCIIGAGAVLTKNVPAHEMWAGNPARRMKNNDKIVL